MIISCIIVDDENLALQHLAKNIAKVPFLRLEASFTNPSAAIEYLENHPTDLIFLDIEMPNYAIDGLDFVRLMGDTQRYIFTTAYTEYALQGYEYNAIDFLHKPFSFDRFLKAVQKARQQLTLSLAATEAESDHIFVPIQGKQQRIGLNEIYLLASERNYVSIYLKEDRIIVLMALSDMEAQLPPKSFARVHKSYIVPYNKVTAVEKDQVAIDCVTVVRTVPLGGTYKKPFLEAIERRTLRKR